MQSKVLDWQGGVGTGEEGSCFINVFHFEDRGEDDNLSSLSSIQENK